MGGALESENWGLPRFSLILEMGSLIAVLSARYFSATHGRGAVGEELTTDFSDGHG